MTTIPPSQNGALVPFLESSGTLGARSPATKHVETSSQDWEREQDLNLWQVVASLEM
jgi:hypothetical protein